MTLLQQLLARLVSAAVLEEAESEALYACVSLAYEDCPQPESDVLKRLMTTAPDAAPASLPPPLSRLPDGWLELRVDPLAGALQAARMRTGCPYVAALQRGTLCAIGLRFADVFRPMTEYLSEASAIAAANMLTRDDCLRLLWELKDTAGPSRSQLYWDAAQVTINTAPQP